MLLLLFVIPLTGLWLVLVSDEATPGKDSTSLTSQRA